MVFFDLVLDYDSTKKHVQEKGWKDFFNFISDLYPDRKIFNVSEAWYNDKKYICKAKGAKGDILIGWRK